MNCSRALLLLSTGIFAAPWGSSTVRAETQMAVLGDSISTGAATHPALTFDSLALWKVFNGETAVTPRLEDLPAEMRSTMPSPLRPPVRLWPTAREFFGGPDWGYRNLLQTLSKVYLDTEEYSWSYMVAAGLGLPPERLLIAAEDGARAEAMTRQMDRVLEATAGVLPSDILVLYTGNDLCGATLDHVTSVDDYENGLAKGFDYLLRNGQVGPGGSDVYLLSFLSILQLLHAEDILAKRVHAFGGEETCRELRAANYRPKDPKYDPHLPEDAWFFGPFMPPNPSAFCPTLFGADADNKDAEIGILANRIRLFRERQEKVVEKYNRIAAKAGADGQAVRFHLVQATAELNFQGEDIAEDCFHLSVAGQAKVARAVLAELKRRKSL